MFSVLMKVKRKPCTRNPLALQLGGWPTCFERLEDKHMLWFHLWIMSVPTMKALYIHLPTHSQEFFPKCWIYNTPIDQLQHTQTHAHASCLRTGPWGALGKQEAGRRLQSLEQFLSTWTGSRMTCPAVAASPLVASFPGRPIALLSPHDSPPKN